jgi:ubiquinol-cytochrome c reductase cytochrome c subunit
MPDLGNGPSPTKEMHDVRRSISIPLAIASAAIFMLMAPAALAQTTDVGQETYGQSCARCHGDDGLGVPGAFPPLAGNPDAADHDYVVVVVTDGLEGKVIMGETYDAKMPSFGGRLSDAEIQAVSAYVVQLSADGPGTTTPTTAPPTGEGSAAAGEDLFRGTTLLSNGGVGCIACHTAGEYDGLGGPTLAISLNGIVDNYGTDGFMLAITDPVVEPMFAVFADHPITDQEAADLAAYLKTTTAGMADISTVDLLILVGIVGFLGLLLITGLVVRGPQTAYVDKLKNNR